MRRVVSSLPPGNKPEMCYPFVLSSKIDTGGERQFSKRLINQGEKGRNLSGINLLSHLLLMFLTVVSLSLSLSP